jgi:hypothetical protein
VDVVDRFDAPHAEERLNLAVGWGPECENGSYGIPSEDWDARFRRSHRSQSSLVVGVVVGALQNGQLRTTR